MQVLPVDVEAASECEPEDLNIIINVCLCDGHFYFQYITCFYKRKAPWKGSLGCILN